MEIRKTRSVCPKCLKNIPAVLETSKDGVIYLNKKCDEHGSFSVPVWAGKVDFGEWVGDVSPLKGEAGTACPDNCGICSEHEAGTCCLLLEITRRCNLNCTFCFANERESVDPTLESLKEQVLDIIKKCNGPLIQFSGGEPTLRDDLPELVAFAKENGAPYIQLNSNGIRLADDVSYVKALKDAGLDIVFLQFDGTTDEIFKNLRGKALLDTKIRAIENCAAAGIGVTLVPTVVKGVNDKNIGELIKFAASMVPKVRAIHFQPVSYFGKYPDEPGDTDRYTLDMLIGDISEQTGLTTDVFSPSHCDHPLCGFHADVHVLDDGRLTPVKKAAPTSCCCSASKNREYVATRWSSAPSMAAPSAPIDMNNLSFDDFIFMSKQRSLSLSAMAFQDAMNFNIERLHRCSLHVYKDGNVLPFCANYLTKM